MSAKLTDGGPAFPRNDVHYFPASEGMSLRDYIAIQAMAGWREWRPNTREGETVHQAIARLAYETADAFLAARAALQEPKT